MWLVVLILREHNLDRRRSGGVLVGASGGLFLVEEGTNITS